MMIMVQIVVVFMFLNIILIMIILFNIKNYLLVIQILEMNLVNLFQLVIIF